MDPSVFRQLQDADWEEIGKRLLAFAAWRAQIYWGYVTPETALPKGKSIEDVVNETILKALLGDRIWDPDKGPLEPWLRDQIKSELDALAKSWAARHEMEVPLDQEGEELWELIAGEALQQATYPPHDSTNPEELALRKELSDAEEKIAEGLITAIYEAADNDTELVEIVDAVQAGAEPKPRYLAESLGVPVEEIYNRIRRLRRRVVAARKGS